MRSSSPIRVTEDAAMLPEIGEQLDVRKMPAHWLMARLGKRVLRPGGIQMTRWLLAHARIDSDDDVVEFAPGLGRPAAMILAQRPRTYTGIERDARATRAADHTVARARVDHARVLRGSAAAVPLAEGAASFVIGEAMLSMQTAANKRAIVREASRLLRTGGRYLIHELAVAPETLETSAIDRIQHDLSTVIQVGVRIGTVHEWTRGLEDAGFTVEETRTAPMRLLEPDRMLRDEGLGGTLRFMFNAIRTPGAVGRLRSIRRVFRTHQYHLRAVAIIARKNAVAMGETTWSNIPAGRSVLKSPD